MCIQIRSFSCCCCLFVFGLLNITLPPLRQNLGGPGLISLFTWRAQPSVEPLRTIRYVRVNDQGQFNQQGWATFQFYGRSLYLLICRLLYILDEPIFIGDEGNFSITVCVQAGIYGRRTPLVIDLPRCEEPMDIFVLTTGSPGENFAVFSVVCSATFICFSVHERGSVDHANETTVGTLTSKQSRLKKNFNNRVHLVICSGKFCGVEFSVDQ